MPIDFTVPQTPINARDPASKPILLQGAIEGHVLVKNTKNALPLKKPKLLSIYGYDAVAPPAVNVPGPGSTFNPWVFGSTPQLLQGSFTGNPIRSIPTAPNGTLFTGGKLVTPNYAIPSYLSLSNHLRQI